MTTELKRLRRRRDERRMKRRAAAMLRRIYLDDTEGHVEHQAVRSANNMKRCSCWMCGHFRKQYGPTLQELKATGDGTR